MSDHDVRPTALSQIRDLLAAVRELAIVAALVLLLAWPAVIRSSLERAGIRSIAGIEFDWHEFAAATDQAVAAGQTVDQVVGELVGLRQQLNDLAGQRQPNNDDIREVSESVRRLEERAREADTSLGNSIRAQQHIIHTLPSNIKLRIPPDQLKRLQRSDQRSSSPQPIVR